MMNTANSVHTTVNTEVDIRKTGLDPDFWYPVARASDLKIDKAKAVSFAGKSIVLVRPKDDRVFALENKCAHRQIPLHVGAVKNNRIKCGYHGWEYDSSGQCVNIPYLRDCKNSENKVANYSVQEKYGFIFVFPGKKSAAEKVPFPKIPSALNDNYKTRYLDRRIDCHYSFMHENLMDMNHQFLHRRLMGGIKTIFLETRQGENWVETDYTFKRNTGKQPLGEKFMLGRRPANTKPKERDLMTIRTEYPYQTLKFWTAGSSDPALDLWNAYIPLDSAQRSNHTFGLMMIKRPSLGFLLDIFWPFIVWFTNGIFAEDRWICELEQQAFDHQGEDQNREIFPAIIQLRQVLTSNGVPIDK